MMMVMEDLLVLVTAMEIKAIGVRMEVVVMKLVMDVEMLMFQFH
jgi:hypothetical protein